MWPGERIGRFAVGRKLFAGIGCPGCGCAGFIAGSAVAATMLTGSHYDGDTQSWAMLFYGGIPGIIIGAILYAIIVAMFKDD
jgi:hypothetical protein